MRANGCVFQGTGRVVVFACIMVLLSSALSFASDSNGSDIESITGQHTRLVWLQDQGGGADTFARGHKLMLYGYDSEDGLGERPLVPNVGNFFKPLFTPDGNSVVVSNRLSRQMYLVEWDSGTVKELGSGVAIEVWQEPGKRLFFKKPKVWVYCFSGKQAENKYGTGQPLYRFPLDDPSKKELIWNKTNLAWSNIQISKDGEVLGGLFPWPHGGVLNLKDKKWQKFGRGCWTSLSPDNSKLLWIFDGLHRNVQIYDVENGTSWKVAINGAPEVKGYEIYHPRWSNHPRYFVMTGPYEKGDGGNKIGGGGEKVEIFIGRLDKKARSVESWIQATHNGRADFYPDLWVEDGENADLSDRVVIAPPKKTSESWPVAGDNLVFLWENMKGANELSEESPVGFYQCNIELRGNALFGRNFQLTTGSGWGETGDAGKKIGEAVGRSGQMAVEFLYTPGSEEKSTILSLKKIKQGGIELRQEKDMLVVVQFSTDGTITARAEWPKLMNGNKPVHLFLNIDGKTIVLYKDGEKGDEKSFELDIQTLKNTEFVIGDSAATSHATIENIALYNMVQPDKNIAANSALTKNKMKDRETVARIVVEATLFETSDIPGPDSLGAYRRALVVNSYSVSKVLEGTYSDEKIMVAEWAVLDRKVVKSYNDPVDLETLVLEKFDHHPELEGERQMMDIFEPDLEMYYRTGSVSLN